MKQIKSYHSVWGFSAALVVGLAFVACGGGTPPAESPPAEAGAEGESATPASEEVAESSVPFDEMSSPDKMKYMKKVVRPHMAKVFQEADPEGYADFKCTNCHGPGAKNGEFEMPTASLPKLNEEEMAEHPQVTQFMKERVVPEMAKLLGEEPFNMETGEGFGCFDCHMRKD